MFLTLKIVVNPKMNANLSPLAYADGTPSTHWNWGETSTQGPDLEALLDCFSDIDTESDRQESNRIAYLVQLLQLRDIRHLSESQQTSRRFLLDMLGTLSASLHPQPQAQSPALAGFDPTCRLKYLVFLLERTAQPALAAKVRQAESWSVIDPQVVVEVRLWLDRNGFDPSELAMLQPALFRPAPSGEALETPLHPHFVALHQATHERTHDYFAQAFLSLSKPIESTAHELTPEAATETSTARGEAVASVFDTPYDQKAATTTRLKAFFIPNRFGEPVIALSFMNEY
jgi:hypothetical protein